MGQPIDRLCVTLNFTTSKVVAIFIFVIFYFYFFIFSFYAFSSKFVIPSKKNNPKLLLLVIICILSYFSLTFSDSPHALRVHPQ